MPLANDHRALGEPRNGFYPLAVLLCGECGLAQLSAIVDKSVLYSTYSYTTSSSLTMRRHFERLLKDIKSEVNGGGLLEIGSNNGDLLVFAQEHGFRSVFGVEPASNLVAHSIGQGAPALRAFWSADAARVAKGKLSEVAVVLARHVFAHVHDWAEFMKALEIVADTKTLICIEVPYVRDLLAGQQFDTIYHEHLSMISLKPIVKLLESTPFHIHRISRYGVHGGVLLLMLRHNDSGIERHLSADEFLAEEHITEQDWIEFSTRAKEKIAKLTALVRDLRSSGKIVSAFGASAKCTVLLNACGFTEKDIAFVTDNSPFKPGKLVPGTQIPIIHEDEMLAEHPDVAIMTAWNFELEILEKMKRYRERGGKFLIPGETVRIV